MLTVIRTLLHCEAQASMNTYEDPADGKKRTALNLVQRNIEVLSRPRGQSANEDVAEEPARAAAA